MYKCFFVLHNYTLARAQPASNWTDKNQESLKIRAIEVSWTLRKLEALFQWCEHAQLSRGTKILSRMIFAMTGFRFDRSLTRSVWNHSMLHGLRSDKANRDTFPSQHILSFTILHDAVSRLGPPLLDESQPPPLDPLQYLGSVRLETQNSAQLTDLFHYWIYPFVILVLLAAPLETSKKNRWIILGVVLGWTVHLALDGVMYFV